MGISVIGIRYACWIVGGILATMAGAFLAFSVGLFADNMSSSRGFIALALVLFARWNPVRALLGAFLFGIADSVQLQLQASSVDIPYQLLVLLPYVLTILIMAISAKFNFVNPSVIGVHIQEKARRCNNRVRQKVKLLQFGREHKIALAALLILLCIMVCFVLFTPENNSVVVYYLAQDIKVPIFIENVNRIDRYYLYDSLYQVAIWQEGELVPIVFTPFDYVGMRYSLLSDISIADIYNATYHTYDNVLQGVKYQLRKDYIFKKYNEYFGRLPSKEEFCLEMDKLIQKVQLDQLDTRLKHYPEAIYFSILQKKESLSLSEKFSIKSLLSLGAAPSEIIDVFCNR